MEVFVPDRYEATEWYEGALGMKVYSEDGARAVRPDLPPDGRLRVAGARAATPNLVTEVGGGPSSTNSSTVSGGANLLSVATAMLRGVHEQACSADPEIPVDVNYNGIRTSTSKYIEYEGGFGELYDLTPVVADPYELTNTYYSADPTMPPRPDLKARLDALKGCQPQDDPTTPELERPCQTVEDAP